MRSPTLLQLSCWTFMRATPPIELSAEHRTTLVAWANARKSQVRVAERARVVLIAAEGEQNLDIAAILSISTQKAAYRSCRFLAIGVLIAFDWIHPRKGGRMAQFGSVRRVRCRLSRPMAVAVRSYRTAGYCHGRHPGLDSGV